jgi:hypothetical protein
MHKPNGATGPFTHTTVDQRYLRDDAPGILHVPEPAVRTNLSKPVAPASLGEDVNRNTAIDPAQDAPKETDGLPLDENQQRR